MALEPIFGGGQVAANAVTTQQLMRGVVDAAPLQIAQGMQARALMREMDESADRAPSYVAEVGSTPTYDVNARVEPVPGDGQRRGSRFDQRA